jgi:hypothetical protein
MPTSSWLPGCGSCLQSRVATSFTDGVLGGWQLTGNYLAESGQPLYGHIPTRSLTATYDTAGDTAYENPGGTAGTGTDVNPVCWNGSASAIAIGSDNRRCGCLGSVVGYVPDQSKRPVHPRRHGHGVEHGSRQSSRPPASTSGTSASSRTSASGRACGCSSGWRCGTLSTIPTP